MSNIIPPLLSDSPPPPPSPDEEDDDEFGDFSGVIDCSYRCDNLSLPPTPDRSPTPPSILNGFDINFNGEDIVINEDTKEPEKDFHDKRKKDSEITVIQYDCSSAVKNITDVKNSSLNDKSEANKTLANVTHSNVINELCESGHCKTDPADLSSSEHNISLEVSGLRNLSSDANDISCKILGNVPSETNQILDDSKLEENYYGLSTSEIEICDKSELNITDGGEVGQNYIYVDSKTNEKTENADLSIHSENSTSSSKIDKLENAGEHFGHSKSNYDLFVIQRDENSPDEQVSKKNDTGISPSNEMASVSSTNSKQSVEVENNITETSDDKFAEFTNFASFGIENEQNVCHNKHFKIPHPSVSIENYKDVKEIDGFSKLPSSTQFSDVSESKDIEVVPSLPDFSKNEIDTQLEENEEFDDFAEFTSFEIHAGANVEKCVEDIGSCHENLTQTKSDDSDDDFGEFAEFSSQNDSNTKSDDFGDFANAFDNTNEVQMNWDPSSSCDAPTTDPPLLLMNEKEAFDKTNTIVKEMFPECPSEEEDFITFLAEKGDLVFNRLGDITDTPALGYQWSKSTSQKMLLNSLNIDARNILYGPSWNPSIPRFAANLSQEPLEPIKTENASISLQRDSPNPTCQQVTEEIPNVQFDWNSSGLTNPLDSIPRNPLEASPDAVISTSVQDVPPTSLTKLEEAACKDIGSKITLEDDEFAPFQSPCISEVPQTWSSSVPLRETYISSDNPSTVPKESILDVEAWLQPTIVTPELPRKVPPENTISVPISEEISDDFDDFQTAVIPSEFDQHNKGGNVQSINKPSVIHDGKNELSTISDNIADSVRQSNPSDFDDFQTAVIPSAFDQHNKEGHSHSINKLSGSHNQNNKFISVLDKSQVSEINIPKPEISMPEVEDDDFTEFQFSTPVPNSSSLGSIQPSPMSMCENFIQKQSPIIPVYEAPKPMHEVSKPLYEPIKPTTEPLKPILEPLKPVQAYLSPLQPAAHINWPDPGITEEELRKFDEVFKQPATTKARHPGKVTAEPKKAPEKSPTNDDEEWTDFISVKKNSPVHKLKKLEREKMSSPDLPLSVFNLGSIQPAKQPIPVITPQGLVQTKLSTNSLNMSPKTSVRSNIITPKPTYQIPPSIISQQFASQAYGFNRYGVNTTNHNQKSFDDDDWGEFVSSPLPSQSASNGFPQSRPHSSQHNSWTNSSPNIITNPRHFVQNGSSASRKVPVNNISKKSAVQNLILPELDFVAPKARTSTSKKK